MGVGQALVQISCCNPQDAADDVAAARAAVAAQNPDLLQEDITTAISQPQQALDVAVTEQQV